MLLITRSIFASFILTLSFNANANWFGGNNNFFSGNNCPPWVNNCNDWPEWTPMYWMEEFSNEFNNNDHYYGNGYNPGYGYRQAPYGYVPQNGYASQRPNMNMAPFNRGRPVK